MYTSNVRAHFRVYFCCTNWFYLKSGVHNHPDRVKFHPFFEPAKLDVELIKVLSAKRMSSGFFLNKLSHLSCLVYCPHIFTFLGGLELLPEMMVMQN